VPDTVRACRRYRLVRSNVIVCTLFEAVTAVNVAPATSVQVELSADSWILPVNDGVDRIVLSGHRISDEDVFAKVAEVYGDEFCHLVLPEEARPLPTNKLGWMDRRPEGGLLWPKRFTHEVLAGERKKYRAEYAAVFLQDPRPREGNLFRPEWFKTYALVDLPPGEADKSEEAYKLGDRVVPVKECWRFTTVDLAVSTSDSADWSVCQVWDVWRGHMILAHQMRARLDGTQIIPRLTEVQASWSPQFMCVESEFSGKYVIDQLREKDITVRPFRAKDHGDKEVRSIAAQIKFEEGKVWFPADRPWVADLEAELLSFPNGAHDDMVDCVSAAALTAQRFDHGEPEPELTPAQAQEKAEEERRQRFLDILNADTRF
jgi:predicted phage terminase large subunit-like protein